MTSGAGYTPPIRRVNRGRNHHYQDAHGRRVPGVTTIISKGVPKPALIQWAANVTAEYAVDHWQELAEQTPTERLRVLEKARFADVRRAAMRGTDVHRLAERLVKGEQVDIPPELAGHIESYVKFLDDFDVQPVAVERVVASHTYGYAGTLDLIADIPVLGQRLLLDVKTSRSGVFGETALQLAGYRYAEVYLDGDAERLMVEVDACAVVHVRADGYDLVPVEAGPQEHRALLYAHQMMLFVERARELVGEAITPPLLREAV